MSTGGPRVRVLPPLPPEEHAPETLIRHAIEKLRPEAEHGDAHKLRALARLEEAVLWLHAPEIIP